MSIDPEVRELLTCALLHLDPRIVDKRVALNSVLVEVALLRANRPTSLAELQAEIDEVVGQRGFLREEDLSHAIQDCTSRRVVVSRDAKYELGSDRAAVLQDAFQYADKTRAQVQEGLTESIELESGRLLEVELAEALCESIERALASRVYDLSLQLARKNLTLEEMLFQLDTASPFEDVDSVLSSHVPPDRELYRQQIKEGIRNYFRDCPMELQERLRFFHHNVLISQILRLDPLIVHRQREWFSRRRIYLDTNVVLAYICEGHPSHMVVSEIVKATVSLGVQILISPATSEEVRGQISRARRNYFRYERDPLTRRMAVRGDDAILATFAQKKKTQPSLDWEVFVAPFDSLEELLLAYDILVESEGYEQAQNWSELPRIRRVIADAKSHWVSESVLDHDSVNCALICALREEAYPADERGQTVWLLTRDGSLKESQVQLLSSETIPSPYCFQIEEWGEIVLPAQSLLTFVFDDFIGHLAQAKFGVMADPQVVQLDFLETVRDAEVDVERLLRLHPEQVSATLTRLQASREVRALAVDAATTEEESKKHSYQQQLQEIIEDTIEETDPVRRIEEEYSRRFDLLQKRLKERDRAIERLTERIAQTESSWAFRVSTWVQKALGIS